MSTYDYYRIFYHVAQQHSFTKAAEVLHNNQPNITRCMNNLETELGCHLFVRSNRGVSLTPEGQKLFNHVAIAFEQLELGETELKRDQSLTSGLISSSCNNTSFGPEAVPEDFPWFFPGNSDRRSEIQRTGFSHLLAGRTCGISFRLAGE